MPKRKVLEPSKCPFSIIQLPYDKTGWYLYYKDVGGGSTTMCMGYGPKGRKEAEHYLGAMWKAFRMGYAKAKKNA